MLDPGEGGFDKNETIVAIVPVTNYKNFVSNFKATADEGDGITKATPHDGDKDVYIANWGQLRRHQPDEGDRLEEAGRHETLGFSAKEADSKDIVLYANIKPCARRRFRS